MRLELQLIKIRDIQFGDKTKIDDNVLYINRSELRELLERDRRIGKVDIELAHPGEKCRILHVRDVIEPRFKFGSHADNLPGPAGNHAATGEG